MKSAYELAMERLEKSAPAAELTAEQRTELAAIDEKFQAKIAEREIFLGDLIEKARREGNLAELAELETQRSREVSRLHTERDEEKDRVRGG